jgi:hypothetical protein
VENQLASVVVPIMGLEYYSYLGVDYFKTIGEEVSREDLYTYERGLPEEEDLDI